MSNIVFRQRMLCSICTTATVFPSLVSEAVCHWDYLTQLLYHSLALKQYKEHKSACHLPNVHARGQPAEDAFSAALVLVEIINGQRSFLMDSAAPFRPTNKRDSEGVSRYPVCLFVFLFDSDQNNQAQSSDSHRANRKDPIKTVSVFFRRLGSSRRLGIGRSNFSRFRHVRRGRGVLPRERGIFLFFPVGKRYERFIKGIARIDQNGSRGVGQTFHASRHLCGESYRERNQMQGLYSSRPTLWYTHLYSFIRCSLHLSHEASS